MQRFCAKLLFSLPLSLALLTPSMLQAQEAGDAGIVRFTILQMNDVYEITRPSGQTLGGLSRVAALRKRLLAENPNMFTVFAGDMLSPSPLNGVRMDGQPLAGKQMVAVLNALGLDFATFGNHEFDITEAQLLQRLAESKFRWISSNVSDRDGGPFPNVPRNLVITVGQEGGPQARVGFFGICVGSNKVDHVTYKDPMAEARAQVAELKGKCDVVIALTHLDLDDDRALAAFVPGIHLIVGGHEHLHNYEIRYERNGYLPPIAKADSNVRTVYVHRLAFDTRKRELEIRSQLVPVNGLPDDAANEAGSPDDVDPATDRLAKRLVAFGFRSLREASGLNPNDVVGITEFPLDGENASVLSRRTNLTQLVGDAFLDHTKESHTLAAIYNSGSIRIDESIEAGPIRVIDILRALPFRARVFAFEIDGELLLDLITEGTRHQGQGGFLQTIGITQDDRRNWLIAGQRIEPAGHYWIAMNDYLLAGRENGYGEKDNPGSINARLNAYWEKIPSEQRDLKGDPAADPLDTRRLVVNYLKAKGKIAIPLDVPIDAQVFPTGPVDHPPVLIQVGGAVVSGQAAPASRP